MFKDCFKACVIRSYVYCTGYGLFNVDGGSLNLADVLDAPHGIGKDVPLFFGCRRVHPHIQNMCTAKRNSRV